MPRKKISKKMKFPLDKPPKVCYNENVKRKEIQTGRLKKISEKIKKPLDKQHKVCYNKNVSKRGNPC
jgi:hypothetical protein